MNTATAASVNTHSHSGLAKYRWFFLGTALPFLVLIAYQIYATHLTAKAATVTNANNLALVLESKLNSELVAAERTVAAMVSAMDPDAMRHGTADRHRSEVGRWLKANIQYTPSASALRYFDADGDRLYGSVDGEPPLNIVDRPHFQQIKRAPAGSTVFSEVTLGRATGRVSMYVDKAVRDHDGSFHGMASAAIDLTSLHQHFQSIDVGAGGVVALRRLDNGASIVRYPGPVKVDNKPALDLPVRHAILNDGPVGVMDIASRVDGSQRIYAYRRIGAFPLFIAVGIADSDYLAEWRRHAALQLAGSILFLAILAVVFFRLAVVDSRRSKGETMLRDAEKLLEEVEHLSKLGGWKYDCASNSITWTDEVYRIHGVGKDYDPGNPERNLQFYAPQDAKMLAQAFANAISDGVPYDLELRIFRSNADQVWVRTIGTPLVEHGKVVSVTGNIVDINERKRKEDEYRTIIQASTDGFWMTDTAGRILDVNQSICRILGYSREELLRMRIADIDAEDSVEDIVARTNQIMREGGVIFLARHRRKDRRVIDVEVSAQYVASLGERFYVFIRDISERRRAETELRKLSRAVEQSPSSIVITDRDGRIEYVNPRFEEVTGYTREQVIGQNPRILKSGLTEPRAYDDLWRTIAAGGEWRGELCNRKKNGEVFWEYAAISGLTDDGGQVRHYIAVKEDITERKHADEALRESESRLSTVFRASPIGISVTRVSDGKFLDVNDAALRLYGYRRDEVVGRTVAELGFYANPARRDELVTQLREQGSVDRFRIDFRRSGGQLGILEISGRIIELQGEKCLVAMMLDVTERKRLEALHLQAQKLESLGTLSGGIAHDFNNILTAIRGNADLAAADTGPDHIAAQSLEEIRKAGARASELVRRIMAFGRPRESQRKTVDLSVVVGEVLRLLRSTLPAGISLRSAFAEDTPKVFADAGQIHEAIVNLTTNAAYAIGPNAGSIEYRLEPVDVSEEHARSVPGLKQGRHARLTVADSGCGMDAGTLERIFDAFYTTKPVGEGTGLGLSMVHGTMKSHGGAVTVKSAPGTGSTFALYFPAAGHGAPQEESCAAAQTPRSAGQRVLYLDDEEALVLLASRALSRLGHQVSGFTDPLVALETFRSRPQDFDVVVTDLSMPHMSGSEFAGEVLAIRPGMPVLMMTGHLDVGDESDVRTIGIRKVILKPATIDELGAALDGLLRANELNAEPSVRTT